jgi:hypothetical protein
MDVSYKAGTHTLRIVARREPLTRRRARLQSSSGTGGGLRWVVAVDRIPMEPSFASRPDAWTAGVMEADRLDRNRGPVV